MAMVGDHNRGITLPVRPPAPYSRAALRDRPDLPPAAGAVGGNDGLHLSPGDNPGDSLGVTDIGNPNHSSTGKILSYSYGGTSTVI